jgi:LPXTG-motif cell wall-anchored protein
MRFSYRAICLLAALILAAPVAAVPATALAQSAGDDQYVDPFQDDQTGQNNGNGNGNGNGNNGSGSQGNDSNDSASQQPTGQSDTGATAGTTAADPNADDSGKLPHTGGVPEGWLVAIGVLLLLGGGFALRRVWPRPD